MFWERNKKVDFGARMRNVQKLDRQSDIIETITNAIDTMFPRTSGTKVEKIYIRGLLNIFVSQFDNFLFAVEVNLNREGQEIEVYWGPELGFEYIHMHYLGRFFMKISSNYL